MISLQNCNWQLPPRYYLQHDVANCQTIRNMNYFLVLGFGPVQYVTPDGQKAMQKSPPCIRTGVLKNIIKDVLYSILGPDLVGLTVAV